MPLYVFIENTMLGLGLGLGLEYHVSNTKYHDYTMILLYAYFVIPCYVL